MRILLPSSVAIVIFRDLKPQNVGFDENGTVKLFDFGNARELAFARLIGEDLGVAGTPRYMANEVGAGREYGFPSDVCKYTHFFQTKLLTNAMTL